MAKVTVFEVSPDVTIEDIVRSLLGEEVDKSDDKVAELVDLLSRYRETYNSEILKVRSTYEPKIDSIIAAIKEEIKK